nr:hypothetical protein Iba_chr01aCG13430 [Ipomoea batatas]
MAGQHASIFSVLTTKAAGGFPVGDEPDFHNLRVELDKFQDVKVSGIGMQVIQNFLVRRETGIIPLCPRKIRELEVAARGLQLSGPERAVLPHPSDTVRGFENHRTNKVVGIGPRVTQESGAADPLAEPDKPELEGVVYAPVLEGFTLPTTHVPFVSCSEGFLVLCSDGMATDEVTLAFTLSSVTRNALDGGRKAIASPMDLVASGSYGSYSSRLGTRGDDGGSGLLLVGGGGASEF